VPKFYLRGFCAPESEGGLVEPFIWIGSIATGEIKRRAPKNVSIVSGYYDGPGGLNDRSASIESHLAKIESAAAVAIARFVSDRIQDGAIVPSEIWRFLSWQAARTPGFVEIEEDWIYQWNPDEAPSLVEEPPAGIENIRERQRSYCVENSDTGENREVADAEELKRYCSLGWKWKWRREDRLESMHMQAWYFQVRHFARLSWVRLNAPEGGSFVTSDRGVSWIVDGFADTPPAALRHPTAQVVVPLTRTVALIGMHGRKKLGVTPREINRFISASVSDWIAGPSRAVVEMAMRDRTSCLRD
jgi:hypothetical protein